jgi:hypothetical protein
MIDPAFAQVVQEAYADLDARLDAAGPVLAGELGAWIRRRAGRRAPWEYLTDVRAFPTLRLPWFLEESLAGQADPALQGELVRSSLAGYYHIRLIDNAMDDPGAPEVRLLPALGVLHLLFEAPYRRLFPGGHPFHETLQTLWTQSGEDTLRDGLLQDFARDDFENSAARKTWAARIPMEAVLHRHGNFAARAPWMRFFECYARWHQMEDDVLDWHADLRKGRPTWFTCEARRHAPAGEAPGAWVMGNGLSWAFGLLDGWWDEACGAAADLGSPGLEAYLRQRQEAHREARERMEGPLKALKATFARALDRAAGQDGRAR